MTKENQELIQLMKELQINSEDVAKHLNVPVSMVDKWTASDENENEPMPPSFLRLLKYSMMTENRITRLF